MPTHKPFSIGALFAPKAAHADVRPRDPQATQFLKTLLERGGIGASTARVALNHPAIVNVGGSEENFRKRFDNLSALGFMSRTPRDITTRQVNTPVGEVPLPTRAFSGGVNPVQTNPSATLGHELGHFLIVSTPSFVPKLKKSGITEERFVDFLAGDPQKTERPNDLKMMQDLAAQLFLDVAELQNAEKGR